MVTFSGTQDGARWHRLPVLASPAVVPQLCPSQIMGTTAGETIS
jgi:hypothetical protein